MYKQYRTDPLTEREKAHLRRSKGIVAAHSAAVGPKPVAKPSDDPKFVAPYTIKTISKRRKFSGSRLNDETRALLEQRKLDRAAFFRALGRDV